MSIEKVKEYLKEKGFLDKVQEFDVSSATVDLAALALGINGARIAKSMGFYGPVDPIIIVTAGDTKIDNHKFKEEFGIKPKMINYDETLETLGHAPGGVCPFVLKEDVKVYLDVSLKRFEKVYPACGSSNSAIGLTIAELDSLVDNNKWVDVCKLKEN